VPGLIEAYVHVVDAAELRQALRFGVTTVLDMGTVTAAERDVFSLRATARTATDMADLRSAGFPATAPNAHGTEFTPPSLPRWELSPRRKISCAARRADGSDYVKLILNGVRSAATVPNLDEPRVKALVDADLRHSKFVGLREDKKGQGCRPRMRPVQLVSSLAARDNLP
jgi:hypothetical protein